MTITKQAPKWKKHLSKDNTADKFQLVVGNNLYHWRKLRGLSQTVLAKKAGVTQAIISELEHGEYNPSTEMITKLAAALDIDWQLLTRKDIVWKLLEVADYLIKHLKKVDILKAMKMVYLLEYEYIQKKGQKLIGLDYLRWNWGPFNKAIYQLEDIFPKKGDIFKKHICASYTSLTDDEITFLDLIIDKYGHMESVELMKYTYQTEPMKGCTIGGDEKMGKKIL